MQRADSLGKIPMLRKIEGRRIRGWQRMKWLAGITDATNMNLGKLQEMVRDREIWHAAVHEVTKSQTGLGNWTNGQGSSTCRAGGGVGWRGILLKAGQGALAGASTAWGAQSGREKTLPHWSLWTGCIFYWLYPCQPPETRGGVRRQGEKGWDSTLSWTLEDVTVFHCL